MAKLAQIYSTGMGAFQAVALIAVMALSSGPLLSRPAMAQANDARGTKGGAAANASPDSALKARVDALEEQLVDMQVVVGTLETLAKNGGGGGGAASQPFPSAGSGADTARIESLETQVRALTAQVQQLTEQIQAQGGVQHRTDLPGGPDTASLGSGNGTPQAESAAIPGFGSTTVSPGNGGNDAIGGLLNKQDQQGQANGWSSPPGAGVATAALPPASEASGDPKQAYETAYGYLLQRDYGSAEASFNDFLKKYPNDSLAGNAQYWLGETYFVRGQYKAAAGAFLKGYQTYGQSGKAPDSLLKLAMSLDRLGQKEAACSSFSELAAKFPTAPQSVKGRAQSERQRIGCQ
ncbi:MULTISPECIES: tol-pal system protein YbgF [unclassified Hyphomicrobium]|uniref:tol-pal system protein YbgF n=1 Tax=unclassified Hyphomicrobium TaxID=2619925 RepID=UPI000213F40C|nr:MULTISPECIES: tol-pal system protein YbgF [unclassified Hyphomicrobium]CCB64250.1 Tol-pal system protein YbgF [Hyphomicrobium sp. MC1]